MVLETYLALKDAAGNAILDSKGRYQKDLNTTPTVNTMRKEKGFGAEIVYVVQRQDCTSFAPAEHIDPEYARLLGEAVSKGVVARVLACEIDPKKGVKISGAELDYTCDHGP